MTRLKIDEIAHPDATAVGGGHPCACSRRTLLRGLGALAASGLSIIGAGCAATGSQLGSASATTCGSNLCLDLGMAANAALTNVDGAVMIEAPSGDTLVVIRTAAASVVALSAVCTHRGCIVDFDATRRILACPCHGSEFSEDGSVIRGPAGRPLPKYSATLSGKQISIAVG